MLVSTLPHTKPLGCVSAPEAAGPIPPLDLQVRSWRDLGNPSVKRSGLQFFQRLAASSDTLGELRLDAGKDEPLLRWLPPPEGVRLRWIGPDAESRRLARDLATAIRFLPKRRWSRCHVEMLDRGLSLGAWWGLAWQDLDSGCLASYLDVRIDPQRPAEIGFCMTDPAFRNRGLLQSLLSVAVALWAKEEIYVSTHEANLPMRQVLAHFGFVVEEAKDDERINGEASLYCRRPAGTGFLLPPVHPAARS